MNIKDLNIDDLFAYLPEGKFAGYSITRIEEDKVENQTDYIIYLRNINNNRLRVVPFVDLTETEWQPMTGWKNYNAVEQVQGLIDPDGKVHANSRRLIENGIIKDSVLIETDHKSSRRNTRKAKKQAVSKGMRNIIVNMSQPGTMGAAMQKAVEEIAPAEPVEEPDTKVVPQYDYSSLSRCYYSDLDIIGKAYLSTDPDFSYAAGKFQHELSRTMHEQCLEDFRNGTKNLYEIKQTQISVNKKKQTGYREPITWLTMVKRLGKAIYKLGTIEEKKEFGIL